MKDRDVQMTHSDDDATLNNAVTKLSEASFAEDWNCAEDKIYDSTTAKERELLLQDCRVQLGRVWPVVSSSEKFAMSNTIPRLIAEVKVLETEVERLDEVNTSLGSQILALMQERDRALEEPNA